jgi:hypothetical protein
MRCWIVALLVGSVVSASYSGATGGKFGKDAEARILTLSKWLEANPLAENRGEVVSEVMNWWIANPKLTLTACALPLSGKDGKAEAIMTVLGPIGTGAFLLENPTRRRDIFAANVAGIESALRAYETAVAQDEKVRSAFYDDLVRRMKAGELSAYVKDNFPKCK